MILSTDMSPVGTELRVPGLASSLVQSKGGGDRSALFAATLEAAGLAQVAGEGAVAALRPVDVTEAAGTGNPAEAAGTVPQQDLPPGWLHVLPAPLVSTAERVVQGEGAEAVKVAQPETVITEPPLPDAKPGSEKGEGAAHPQDMGRLAGLPEKGDAEAPVRQEQANPTVGEPEEGAAFEDAPATGAEPLPLAPGEPPRPDVSQAVPLPVQPGPDPRIPDARPEAPQATAGVKPARPPSTPHAAAVMAMPVPMPVAGAAAVPARGPVHSGTSAARTPAAAPVAADPAMAAPPEGAPTITTPVAQITPVMPDNPRAHPADVAADLAAGPGPDAAMQAGAAPLPGAPATTAAPAMAPPLPGLSQPLDMLRPDWTGSIAMTLAELGTEGGTMIVDLAPEELGPLRITLTVEGERTTVQFQTETPEAARLLSQGERQLALDLARGGMNLAGHEANPGGGWGGRNGRPQTGGAGLDAGLPSAPVLAPHHRGIVNLIA